MYGGKPMFYTYLHIKKDTGQPFYAGVGTGRRKTETAGKKRSAWWHKTAEKHGWYADIVQAYDTAAEALEGEIALIAFFGRQDLGTGSLVNQTAGGDGVKEWSSELRARLSAASKKRWQDPLWRERQIELLKVANRKRWTPEACAAAAARWTPEMRANASAVSHK